MRRLRFYTILLSNLFSILPTSATLPPALQLTSGTVSLSNGSHEQVTCLQTPNVTYPIAHSPLDLAITFGHRSFLSWQLTTFLQSVLIDIKSNATNRPNEYIPHGYYHYHEPGLLGTVSVIPSFFRNFTWSDLYLVLHGLAEYVVTAPHAYEMCVEINFRRGGLAGVIFIGWWTPDVPAMRKPLPARRIGNPQF